MTELIVVALGFYFLGPILMIGLIVGYFVIAMAMGFLMGFK